MEDWEPAIGIMSDMGVAADDTQEMGKLHEIQYHLSMIPLNYIRLIVFGIVWRKWANSVRACLANCGYDTVGLLDFASMAVQGVLFLPVPGTGPTNRYARQVVARLAGAIPHSVIVLAFGQSYTYGGVLEQIDRRHIVCRYVTEWDISPHSRSIAFSDAFLRAGVLAGYVDWGALFSAHFPPVMLRDPISVWCGNIRSAIPPGYCLVTACSMRRCAWATVIATSERVMIGSGEYMSTTSYITGVLEWIADHLSLRITTCEIIGENEKNTSTAGEAANRLRHFGTEVISTIVARNYGRDCVDAEWSARWIRSTCYNTARIMCMRTNGGQPYIWPPLVCSKK